MSEARKTLYLIDGSAMFYRAYFAFIRNPLINSKGVNTSATYGFVNSLLKVIKDEKPDYIAVAWDTKAPTFRHEQYAEYKSTRAKMPDELVEQLPDIRETVEALNIAHFEMEGFEADDVIGTIATRAAANGLDVWMVTGDKDFFQLVNDHVRVYTPTPGSAPSLKLGREEVLAKFGVYPELVIDKLALMGDSSDNVPGIPGIGPKTADSLLGQFGSLAEILDKCDQIKGKGVRAKVTEHADSARMSRELVTIMTDVPIECDLETLRLKPFDYEATKALFMRLEFHRLLKEILPETDAAEISEAAPQASTSAYHTVTTLKDLRTLLRLFSKRKEIAVDTETTSLNTLQAKLVGVSLADRANEAYYIPLGHSGEEEANLPFDEALAEIKKLLENKKVQKFGQNIKYDHEVLRRYGIDINPISFDTMLASYVIDPTSRQHSLDFQALKHFDYRMQPISELIGTGKRQLSFAQVPIRQATPYAAEDADYTFRLRGVLAPKIDELGMNSLYYDIELPLVRVLADMELEGVRVDADFLADLSRTMGARLDGIKSEIFDMAGGEFNINSTQQLSHILFDKLGLPTKGKTAKKTGYSTDVRVLEELAAIHEFPAQVLQFRQLTKLISTYIDAIPKLIDPETGRVHTSFNQTIAATGRLSSTDPNLQNIPVRTEEGREIRKAFVARDDDHTLLVADYSQIELRILAHITGDKTLIEAFKNGEDIHARTAAEVYGVDISEVTSAQRRSAKTANFAVIYGVTAYGLAQQSELDLQGAKAFIDTYLERYPGILKYMETTKQFARDNGYVLTMFNRRRYVREINDKKAPVRQFAERIAINSPIQGTAADMIKKAMLRVHERLVGLRTRMVLQVHDELVFDVHRDELEQVQEIVREGMEQAVKLKVPVVVDMGHGPNWLEAK